MRITPTLLGVLSHADGYHYLRGLSCCTVCRYLSQCRDIVAQVHMPSGAKLWQNRHRYVQPRTHTQQISENVVNLCGNRVKSVIKGYFLWCQIKKGICRNIRHWHWWWELTLADGFQTQVFYMFITFLEICFYHSPVASDKAKNQTLISQTLGFKAGAVQRQSFRPMRQKSSNPLNGKRSSKLL